MQYNPVISSVIVMAMRAPVRLPDMNLDITTKNSTVITLNHSIRKVRPKRPAGLSTVDDPVRVTIPTTHLGALKPGISPRPVEYHLRNRSVFGAAVITTAFPDSREGVSRETRKAVNDLTSTTHARSNRPTKIQRN